MLLLWCVRLSAVLPLWSSQSLRWSRCVDIYHGKGAECYNGDYMGHKSGKTEGWKVGESTGRLQEESTLKLHPEPCWSSRWKHRQIGLVGKTVSPVLDLRLRVASETFREVMGYWGLRRSKPEIPLWIPQPVEMHRDQAGWGDTVRSDSSKHQHVLWGFNQNSDYMEQLKESGWGLKVN